MCKSFKAQKIQDKEDKAYGKGKDKRDKTEWTCWVYLEKKYEI